MTTPTHSAVSPPPPYRDPSTNDVHAPGIYPGEVVVKLDTAELIAVYIEALPLDNNQGISIYTSARVVNDDGSTKMAGDVQMVVEFRHVADHDDVAQKTISLLSQACLAGILGEPVPTFKMPDETDAEGNPAIGQTVPAIDFGTNAPPPGNQMLQQISVRTLIAANDSGSSINAGALL